MESVQSLMGVCAQIPAVIVPEEVFDIQGLFRICGAAGQCPARHGEDDNDDDIR